MTSSNSSSLSNSILGQSFLDEEETPIIVDDEPQPLLQKALHLTIAGKLISSRRPSISNLKYLASRQWDCIDKLEVFDLGKSLYSFQFFYEEHKTKALNGGPWYVDAGLLLVEEIMLNTPVDKMVFSFSKLWIRIHDLPPKGFNLKFGKAVGSALGEFCDIDIPAEAANEDPLISFKSSNLKKYLRIKAKVNILKPLKRRQSIQVRGEDGSIEAYVVRLSYERLPEVCFCCGLIGHSYLACSLYEEGTPLAYGEWIRSDKFYKHSSLKRSATTKPHQASSSNPASIQSPSPSKDPTPSLIDNGIITIAPANCPDNTAPLAASTSIVSLAPKPPTHPLTANTAGLQQQPHFHPPTNTRLSPCYSTPWPVNKDANFSPITQKNLFSPSDISHPTFSPFPDSTAPTKNVSNKVATTPVNSTMDNPISDSNPVFAGAVVPFVSGVSKTSIGQKRKFKSAIAISSKITRKDTQKAKSSSPRKKSKAISEATGVAGSGN